jgi:hypothetical protein
VTPDLNLDTLTLYAGGHDPGDAMCVMEAVAFVAGEPWSDHPECASKVIGAFMRAWNDTLPDDRRQMLKPYIPRLVGTAAAPEVELRRSFMACDWLVRVFTPAWLDRAGLAGSARALEQLPELTTTELVDAALPIIRQAREDARAAAWDAAAAWAARAAAGDAAAAAGDAAAAARAAARAAAGAPLGPPLRRSGRRWGRRLGPLAGDAAGAAWDARAAARAAAGAAARDALADTVTELQQSALELIDRMIDVDAEAAA